MKPVVIFMNFIKYLISKFFFKQVIKSFAIVSFLLIVLFFYLKISTNHNNYINVPDLTGIEFDKAIQILNDNKLNYVVIDSALYNPDLPKFSVVEQIPKSSSEVKKNRKIYLTLNPSNYGKVSIPKITQITQRSAVSSLLASDLEVGEITYEDNIGKDMVLKIFIAGKEISEGDLVPKKSKIDLVLGNGQISENKE